MSLVETRGDPEDSGHVPHFCPPSVGFSVFYLWLPRQATTHPIFKIFSEELCPSYTEKPPCATDLVETSAVNHTGATAPRGHPWSLFFMRCSSRFTNSDCLPGPVINVSCSFRLGSINTQSGSVSHSLGLRLGNDRSAARPVRGRG